MIASRAALRSSLVIRTLSIFLADLAQRAVFVKDYVKHFSLAEQDFAELFFLDHGDGLQLDHFQYREERDDHGMTRGASLEKTNEVGGVVIAGQDLRAELRHHLRHGELLVLPPH